jgi:hypothetical protein
VLNSALALTFSHQSNAVQLEGISAHSASCPCLPPAALTDNVPLPCCLQPEEVAGKEVIASPKQERQAGTMGTSE